MRRIERVRHFASQHPLGRLSGEELVTALVMWERQVLKLPGVSGLHRPAIQQVLSVASGGLVGLRGLDDIDLAVLVEVGQNYG